MLKSVKKVAAVLAAALLCLTFTGCHKAGEIALTVGGTQYTSGFYSCALVFADIEGRQTVNASLTDTSSDIKYTSQKIDGVKYSDWVKNRALELCREITVYEQKCNELGIDLSGYNSNAQGMAEYYWSYYGYSEIFTPNGVSESTFTDYMVRSNYKNAYFDSLYAAGGTQAVEQSDIDEFLKNNYVYADLISVDISDMEETEIQEKEQQYKAYADRIKKGENFGKIYDEVYSTTYYTETDTGAFNHTFASVYGTDETSYASDYYDSLKDLKAGECKLLTVGSDDEKEMILVLIGDILSEDNTYLETIESDVLWALKGEEFENSMADAINNIALDENTFATNRFKVGNIEYPEGY